MLTILAAQEVIVHLCTLLANHKLGLSKYLPSEKEWRIIKDMEEILDVRLILFYGKLLFLTNCLGLHSSHRVLLARKQMSHLPGHSHV